MYVFQSVNYFFISTHSTALSKKKVGHKMYFRDFSRFAKCVTIVEEINEAKENNDSVAVSEK